MKKEGKALKKAETFFSTHCAPFKKLVNVECKVLQARCGHYSVYFYDENLCWTSGSVFFISTMWVANFYSDWISENWVNLE